MPSARLWAARSPTSLLNSSCPSLETDLYGTYLSFLQENPILRSHLRSVRALTVTPNSFRIISVTMSICHEPVSKPHFFGLLLSQRRTVIPDVLTEPRDLAVARAGS